MPPWASLPQPSSPFATCSSPCIHHVHAQVRWSLSVVGTEGSLEVLRGGWGGSRGAYTLHAGKHAAVLAGLMPAFVRLPPPLPWFFISHATPCHMHTCKLYISHVRPPATGRLDDPEPRPPRSLGFSGTHREMGAFLNLVGAPACACICQRRLQGR